MPYPRKSRWNKRAWLALAVAVFCFPALAQTSVIFERATIRIDPVLADKGDGTTPVEVRQSITYEIEVRSEESAKLEYIHSLNELTAKTGVMITFLAPAMAGLPAFHNYTAVDILFIAEDGTILKTVENQVLADLREEILAKDPIKAFLFLKAGEIGVRGFKPQDMVVGSVFTPPETTPRSPR